MWCYVCYRYIAEGKRILHPQQLFDELAAVIEGQDERKKIQQGAFGHILQCTQVYMFGMFNFVYMCL